jgi:DNA-directed RNA polymerase alpha subunit
MSCNFQDQNHRQSYLEWLYRRSGRTCNTYSGLLAERTRELLAADMRAHTENDSATGPRRTHLNELDVPTRVYNALRRAGYTYVDELNDLNDETLLFLKNLGPTGVQEVRTALATSNKVPQ